MRSKEEVLALKDAWYQRAREQSLDTLLSFLNELAQFEHDYNSICYATAAAAVGASWAMDRSPHGGITGFQAGAIMWEYIQQWNGITCPAWILKADELLYPQYEYKFTTLSLDTWKWLQDTADEKLLIYIGDCAPHPEVRAHWQSIVAGKIPFGLLLASS